MMIQLSKMKFFISLTNYIESFENSLSSHIQLYIVIPLHCLTARIKDNINVVADSNLSEMNAPNK